MPPDKDWPHAPIHRLNSQSVFIVTGATLYKRHLFNGDARLSVLENELLTLAKQYYWQLEAWSVFSNQFHLIRRGNGNSERLDIYLKHFYGNTARAINAQDNQTDRQVWYNYWETELTYERSYLARLNYVHQNRVKHGLVQRANQYPWCSAAWLREQLRPLW